MVGKIVILTLGAFDSASFNLHFGTSVEMDPILTIFVHFCPFFTNFLSILVGKFVILILGAIDSDSFNSNLDTNFENSNFSVHFAVTGSIN